MCEIKAQVLWIWIHSEICEKWACMTSFASVSNGGHSPIQELHIRDVSFMSQNVKPQINSKL